MRDIPQPNISVMIDAEFIYLIVLLQQLGAHIEYQMTPEAASLFGQNLMDAAELVRSGNVDMSPEKIQEAQIRTMSDYYVRRLEEELKSTTEGGEAA